MMSLTVQTLQHNCLTNVLNLDEVCFGGIWTRSGYIREIESPNSDIIITTHCADHFNCSEGQTDASIQKIGGTNFTHLSDDSSLLGPKCLQAESLASNISVIGMGCAWAIVDEAHITLLAVHPNFQRQGLGRLMLWTLLQCAYWRGMKRATLEVRSSNKNAIALYERFGLRVVGTRKQYYRDTGEDALVLWRGGLQSSSFPAELLSWRQRIDSLMAQNGWQVKMDIPGF